MYGQGTIDNQNGDYVAKISSPLADGVYEFRMVAVDSQGNFSQASPPYIVKVITRGNPHPPNINVTDVHVPGGPLGLR